MQLLVEKQQIKENQHYLKLVSELFSVKKSIFFASLTALMIIFVCIYETNDINYYIFIVLFGVTGVARCASMWLYKARSDVGTSLKTARRWEIVALSGAWTFSGLTGLIGAYTVNYHADSKIEILIIGSVIGYIAGISSRNASRFVITIGQISAIYFPFTLSLLFKGDIVHLSLGIFITLLCGSAVFMARSVHDTIVARQRAQAELEVLAHHDSMTGLLNRNAFMIELDLCLTDALTEPTATALISIDLDRFKEVNDSHGHAAGDAVLKETALRIMKDLQANNSVARLGGDEFMIALPDTGVTEARRIATDIIHRLSEPFAIAGTQVICGASAGIAVAPRDGSTILELVRHADLAIYEAKSSGRGQVAFYSPAFSQKYQDRIALEHDLQSAISNGQLELYYQPIVDPRTGIAVCCEALLRWNHPKRGIISPVTFIPVAEATGLIVPIGEWALRTACAQAKSWPQNVTVAVNLSSLQFRAPCNLVEIAKTVLAETGLPASRLELEVTESVLIDDTEQTRDIITAFHNLGVRVSLDDFGTGFSSLAYLSDFPFSKVKIDKKFSQDMGKSLKVRQIVKGIAQITRELGIDLVAEGVETHGQLLRILELEIHAVQGYYYSRPVQAAQIGALLSAPIKGAAPEVVIKSNRLSA
jgi:diguanylate cyclase (GGDEF)-like protein